VVGGAPGGAGPVAEGRFLVEGLSPARARLSPRQRPKSLFSVLDPQEIERGVDPVSVAPFLGGEAAPAALRLER
jgi:hypothetical protein